MKPPSLPQQQLGHGVSRAPRAPRDPREPREL